MLWGHGILTIAFVLVWSRVVESEGESEVWKRVVIRKLNGKLIHRAEEVARGQF